MAGVLDDRYQQVVHLSPDGILVCADDRIALANPAALRLCGAAAADDLLGRSLGDLLDDGSRARVRQQMRAALAGETAPPLDAMLLPLAGAARDVEVRCVGLGPRTALLVLHDITERKRTEATLRETEERLTLAFAGAQEGVWDWNLETNAVVYSPRWKEMLGYADHEIEPHISAWERLVHPEDRAAADRANAGVARGEATYEAEFRLRHKNGHYVQVLSRGFPVRRHPDGAVVRIVGTHFDLTARQRVEAERARAELLARLVLAQEDERRRIAREMHDQFGQDLTALAHAVRRLREWAGTAGMRADVEELERIAQQLDRDVDHLVWELRPTALDDLGLQAALGNYVHDWSKRVGVAARFHTAGLADERLTPDRETALYRIAQEALTNAARHARARHVEVILERRSGHVLLVVEDDGVGFDAETAAGGGGCGLVGMRERAAMVGASLEIESAAGQGTTILVRLDGDRP